MRKSAVHKIMLVLFLFCLLIFASFALRGTATKVSRSFDANNITETDVLHVGVKSHRDTIVEALRVMDFERESNLESIRATKTVSIQKAVLDNGSYNDLPDGTKNFYSLFLKLMILLSCALFSLFLRRWLILVSNFKIGLNTILYVHLKDGKKGSASFQ